MRRTGFFFTTTIVAGFFLGNLLAAPASDVFLSQAAAEAAKIQSTDQNPFARMRRALILVEAAALGFKEDRSTAIARLDAAKKLVGEYHGIGQELGPILLSMLAQSITRGEPESRTFDAIGEVLKGRDGMVAFHFFLERGAHIQPALTRRIITEVCPAPQRESCCQMALLQITKVDPTIAWTWADKVPGRENVRNSFQSSIPLVFGVASARERKIEDIPDGIKLTVAKTCRTAFAEAKRQQYKGEFSFDTMSTFGAAWYAVAPHEAKAAVASMKTGFSAPDKGHSQENWEKQWLLACKNTRNALMLSGLLELVEDPDAERVWETAATSVASLSNLLSTQPETKKQEVKYRLSADGLAQNLPLLSLPKTGRLLEMLRKDSRIEKPQEVWLEVIACHARSRPELAVKLVSELDSPVLRSEAYLVIARAQLGKMGPVDPP